MTRDVMTSAKYSWMMHQLAYSLTLRKLTPASQIKRLGAGAFLDGKGCDDLRQVQLNDASISLVLEARKLTPASQIKRF